MIKKFQYPWVLAAGLLVGCQKQKAAAPGPVTHPTPADLGPQSTKTALEAIRAVEKERSGGHLSDLSNIDFAGTLKDAYVRSMFPRLAQSRREAETGDLKSLYEAAHLITFYTLDRTVLDDLRGVVTELEKRGQATPEHIQNVHKQLHNGRQFEEARAWAKEHANGNYDFLPTPTLREDPSLSGQNPTHLVVIDPSTVERRSVDIQRGVHVVVVADYQCHFSNDAVSAIDQDTTL